MTSSIKSTKAEYPTKNGVIMQNQSRKTLIQLSVGVAALAALLASSALAHPVPNKTQTTGGSESIASLPDLNTTSAGEPLH